MNSSSKASGREFASRLTSKWRGSAHISTHFFLLLTDAAGGCRVGECSESVVESKFKDICVLWQEQSDLPQIRHSSLKSVRLLKVIAVEEVVEVLIVLE